MNVLKINCCVASEKQRRERTYFLLSNSRQAFNEYKHPIDVPDCAKTYLKDIHRR